ncbi:Flp pilus assembly protein CpaB [Nereida sp. MMG025]|uniref:Flp pilus assembly protein CpaB n=1 Tax=Nereida sp. MMG025 TaxID=2909981 RepID=UPI001F39D7DA|nr:Flp pilus assembly protein CpaB [Nereida sp. MMG025]MCF6445004.1 Flp pilus assembly protein CpaB [Nereida sp. MMG025]
MRMVFALVLLLGLGLAGFAVHVAQGYVSQQRAELEAQREAASKIVPTDVVFITTRAVRYGEPLQKDDMKPILWPVEAIPEGAFTDQDVLFPKGFDVPRVALRAMEKGEAVLEVKVTDAGADAGITSRLSPGMRAFAINVNAQSGVSGFLRPNDRVDVYWSGNVQGATNSRNEPRDGRITKLIQTGLKLIAIDQSADMDRTGAQIAGTVTVEATPQQVALLTQAQATGDLSLSLVGSNDDTEVAAFEVNQNELLGITPQEIQEVQKDRVCTIRTRKGAEVIEIPIPCTN